MCSKGEACLQDVHPVRFCFNGHNNAQTTSLNKKRMLTKNVQCDNCRLRRSVFILRLTGGAKNSELKFRSIDKRRARSSQIIPDTQTELHSGRAGWERTPRQTDQRVDCAAQACYLRIVLKRCVNKDSRLTL